MQKTLVHTATFIHTFTSLLSKGCFQSYELQLCRRIRSFPAKRALGSVCSSVRIELIDNEFSRSFVWTLGYLMLLQIP
jgi:hypothetical protein